MKCCVLMVVLLVGCGGQPDGLFAPTITRVMADAGPEAQPAEDAPRTVDAPPQADAQAEPESAPQPGQDALAEPPGAEPEPVPEAAAPEAAPDAPAADDATCWPPLVGCQCPCYRNHAMDSHCGYQRPSAWVCESCAPAGCVFEYDAQASMACCP